MSLLLDLGYELKRFRDSQRDSFRTTRSIVLSARITLLVQVCQQKLQIAELVVYIPKKLVELCTA